MITNQQKALYMENRQKGDSQALAAAKAGFTERTGRAIDSNTHRSKQGKQRAGRTRIDPFLEVWEAEVVPLIKSGIHQATFLLQVLQQKHPGKYSDTTKRTLQRKVKEWKALHGPAKEVIFRQDHKPGELAISDFTHPDKIQVTIKGEPFVHIFYHFRLVFSGFNYMQVFSGSGEPYDAFAQGLQEALFCVGGVPEIHRTDSLSASFKNLSKDAKDDLTDRYRAFANHFDMKATRINPGESHENGAIESSHHHIKERVYQHLILRGNSGFDSLEEYREFISMVVQEHNRFNCKNLETERANLQPLPATKAVDYTELVAVVSSTSTIDVKRVTYSVPSRLIGERLHTRVYNDRLECYLGRTFVCTLKRSANPPRGLRYRVINYRDVVDSLVKKPGAFRGSKIRNDLLPNENYQYIWKYVDRTMKDPYACRFIVGLLHLAATQNCEPELAHAVIELITNNAPLNLGELQTRFNKHKVTIPILSVSQHSLGSYNQFIPSYQEAQS